MTLGSLPAAGDSPKFLNLIIKVPARTPPGDTLFVTGDSPELCSWNPRCVPLQSIGNWTYSARVQFAGSAENVELKVTRGTWQTEAAGSGGEVYQNVSYPLNGAENELVLNVINWADMHLGVTGNLQILPGIESPQLGNSRSVRVWLPPSYNSDSTKRYPVLYMHDGQNIFDPATSGSGVEWEIDERMTALIAGGQINEAIVVGVDCNQDRLTEYDYTQKGEQYARFLIDVVKPMVDAKFRTLADRSHTFAMGSSAGGHISLSLVWKHSDVFSKAAALSLPVVMHDSSIYQIVNSSPAPASGVSLYIDSGDYAGDAGYPGPGAPFVQHLKDIGFPASHLYYRVYPYGDHFESDWARRVEVPLRWLLGTAAPAGIEPVTQDVAYADYGSAYKKPGDRAMNLMDVHLPFNSETTRGPVPAVIVFHGGGFVQGDKADMTGMAEWLSSKGYAVFNANYRLANSTQPQTGYPYPSAYDDAEALVRWIHANAATYGVDGSRVFALGVSAGATIAAHLGVLGGSSSQVKGVIDLAGRMDFSRKPVGSDPRPDFLPDGGYVEASPITHVDRNSAPFLFIHGLADTQVEIDHSRLMLAKLLEFGVVGSKLLETPTDHLGIVPWVLAQRPPELQNFLASISDVRMRTELRLRNNR